MFKRVVSLILAIAVLSPAPALAEAAQAPISANWRPTPADGQRFLDLAKRDFSKMGETANFKARVAELRAQIDKGYAVADKTAGHLLGAAHAPTTILQIWIIVGAYAAYQNERLKPLSNSTADVGSIVNRTGDMLINNFDIFAGMIGASAANFALGPTLNHMGKQLTDRMTNKLASSFVHNSLVTYLTFAGWEFGAQAWRESIYLLDEGDIPNARKLRVMDLFTGKGTPEEYKLLEKVLKNLLGIMTFVNPERTGQVVANTFRQHFFTGPILASALGMAVAGTAAGTIAPGAGNIAGFCIGFMGGLVGGGIYFLLPESGQVGVTDVIRETMLTGGYDAKLKNEIMLKQYVRFIEMPNNPMLEMHQKGFIMAADLQKPNRDFIVSTLMLQIHEDVERLHMADTVLETAKLNLNIPVITNDDFLKALQGEKPQVRGTAADLIKEFVGKREESKRRLEAHFDRLRKLYADDADFLGQYVYNQNSNFSNENRQYSAASVQKFQAIYQFLTVMYAGILPERMADLGVVPPNDQVRDQYKAAAEIYLNLFFMRGFDEAMIAP